MKKLLALVIAGVAVKYFLDTENGKNLTRQVKNWLDEAQDAFNDTIHDATSTVEQTARKIDRNLPGTNG